MGELTISEVAAMGGRARAKKLSRKRQSEIGRLAAASRPETARKCLWCGKRFVAWKRRYCNTSHRQMAYAQARQQAAKSASN